MTDKTQTKQGFAVQVVRRYRRPNGSLTDGHPINFWNHPCDRKPRLHEDDAGYAGVPMLQPLNSKWRPPLVFATREEAEIATSYFNTLWGKGADTSTWREDVFPGEYRGRVREVNAYPTHRLSNEGFQALSVTSGLFA